jgi:UMF1 family MFS transporter
MMVHRNYTSRPKLPRSPVLGRFSWALFDWANSPFSTLIITFIFPAYLQSAVWGDPVAGQSLWGYAIAGSGLVVAVLAPVLGAVADVVGRRKPWIFASTLICVTGASLLWFTEPSPHWGVFGLLCVVLANIGLEFGVVFNNAMLPDIVPKERIGRLSGWAWGFGYAGGLVALVIALMVFIWPEHPPFGLDADAAEHVRIVGPMAALWLAVFSIPLFLFTPDRPASAECLGSAVRMGLQRTMRTLIGLRRNRSVALFLLAHMIYADGLLTLFAFGGVYAVGAFGLSLDEVVIFGIALNVAAGLGAFGFAWIDDWIGSKRIIIVALLGLILASIVAVAATELVWFWVGGIGIGTFVGPAQSASRSLMAKLSPADEHAAYFGLYSLSGKATAFLGPAIVASVTAASGSQRIGLAAIIPFFVIGLLAIWAVEEPRWRGLKI